jgi:hypothetical protein
VRGEATAPAPESEPREERERPTRAQTGTGPRGAALDARCRKIVGDTGITMRIPRRRAGEAYPAYGRRAARAIARIGRVYRMLSSRLSDLPGAQEDELFRSS